MYIHTILVYTYCMCIYITLYMYTHLPTVYIQFPYVHIFMFSIPQNFHFSCFHSSSISCFYSSIPHSPFPQLSNLCIHCTQYFSKGSAGEQEDRFLSETSEAYAFGSNSSSQLAMGSQEKVLKATHMPHMANSQVVRRPLVISSVHTKLPRFD